ncbi:hypothetical protein Aca07nite_52340 [Actinoplanes capillaceus]|uniref:Uncharacterized protein n=1 Tax=Actinoplanes campanulatus TaxID=113559 RepID=A0ABQ3WNX9_9ACTN|nr:hypothetical protein [Actinoplanes capillaceus]GID47959.1 hypothetical protein Aca07nite_52340 [Actinoplanes capillaceus]
MTIFETASGRWIHPDPYRARFPRDVCDAPAKLARAWADERLAKATAEADARRAVRNALTRFAG